MRIEKIACPFCQASFDSHRIDRVTKQITFGAHALQEHMGLHHPVETEDMRAVINKEVTIQ